MIFKKVELRNFRNIEFCEINFSDRFNIFWGNNGQGKTNIIESIFLASSLKSFRNNKNSDYVKLGKDKADIKIVINVENSIFNINTRIDNNTKKTLINEKSIDNLQFFFNLFKTILFTPEDSFLIKSYPGLKRNFIDRAILLTDPTYIKIYLTYQKILKNRNVLLRENKNLKEIEPWTEYLVNYGTVIREKRINFIERITPIYKNVYSLLNKDSKEYVELNYLNDFKNKIYENTLRELTVKKEQERKYKQTLVGPHRDGVNFLLNGEDAKIFSSQGQQKSMILAFKIAQLIDIKNVCKSSAVIILDDINSEIDSRRKDIIFEILADRDEQVFLTTTDNPDKFSSITNKSKFFRVDRGQVSI